MQRLRSLLVISLSLTCLSLPLALGQVGRVATQKSQSAQSQVLFCGFRGFRVEFQRGAGWERN